MSEGSGLDALSAIREEFPETKVVMLSTYDNPTYLAQAVARGASDYVLKGSTREQLVEAITSAIEGKGPTTSSPFRQMAGQMKTKVSSSESAPLTRREEQVLRHIAFGLSNKEIALSLEISVETVKEHVQNILRKIGVADRTQAAVWAVRRGLVA
jgi:DNA-binding NarL/FixJ family response regulator